MPTIHDYLRRTYGPLEAKPEAKAEKVKPEIVIRLDCDFEKIAREVREMFDAIVEQAIEEVRRRLEGGF